MPIVVVFCNLGFSFRVWVHGLRISFDLGFGFEFILVFKLLA